MALAGFDPEVWSSVAALRLDRALVWAQESVATREHANSVLGPYDVIHVGDLTDVTVGTYVPGTPINRELLASAEKTITVNQFKYVNFEWTQVNRMQNSPTALAQGMQSAAQNLSQDIDTYVSGVMVAGVHADNKIGSGGSPTSVGSTGEAYANLQALAVKLDEKDVPDSDRFVIAPPAFIALIEQDARFSANGSNDAQDVARNRFSGRVAGFDLYKSNVAPSSSGATIIVAGHRQATSVAIQAHPTNFIAYMPDDAFGEAVKALTMYGATVIKPEALAALYADTTDL